MKGTLFPARPESRPSVWGARFDWLMNALVVIGLGVILGSQYLEPDKRLLSVAAAVIVIGIAWRLDMASGIGVMVLALPYPRGTVFGSTNIALILLLVIIYMLRMRNREVAPPRSTPLDPALIAFYMAYVISFYNIENSHDLYFALQNFQLLTGTFIMFYLIVNSVRTEADVIRLHRFHTVSVVGLMLIAIWELNHPGQALVPGWIYFENTHGDEFNRHGIRVGSMFYDFELLADFCGLNVLFMIFQLVRQKGLYGRVLYAGILVLVLFIMFATITRGPVVSLSVALVYLAFLMRRHMRVVPVTLITTGGLALVFGMNFFVANFTRSGNLFDRVAGTQMVGWMPETRVGTWTEAWGRMMMHPIIGWGPYYTAERGIDFWYWPHNLYLYVGNLTGLVGLSCFLWLFWSIWRMTRPRTDTLDAPSYLDGYLLIAHVQMAFFVIDQFKIEYLRNYNYPYQVWLMFAMWTAAYRVRQDQLRAGGTRS